MKPLISKLLANAELSPEERREVLEDLFVFGKAEQLPFLIRMSVLLVLSTLIATAGLLSDSAAVVIGAMLVAPMMTPVMAAAGAVVMGWSRRFYTSMWLVLAMGVAAVLISGLITLLSPDVVFMPEQVLARTRPTFYDLLIALAAGSAGAYTITRKQTGAIPGVAVAVALLPPLASAGVLLVTGEFELAVRAVTLFFTNLIAMVLAGALTFMACGVSPASARRHSAAFIKSQLWLFALLAIAVSIPLYFYSEKIIFNAKYRAARSETMQNWLFKNDLRLMDIEILRDSREILLSLEGPNPPVDIQSLYEKISEESEIGDGHPFTIRYNWKQRVEGQWPVQSSSIDEMAQGDLAQKQELLSHVWVWEFTQYDAERGARPPQGDDYTLNFEDRNVIYASANCGKKKGVYSLRGKSMSVEMKRLNWFKCRDDNDFQVFLGDLQRSKEFFIDEGQLKIPLSTNAGIMYFRKR